MRRNSLPAYNSLFPRECYLVKGGFIVATLDRIALVLVIIGALNWLLVGVVRYDLVAAVFGGADSIISRVIYTLVGIAGLWAINLLFRPRLENR